MPSLILASASPRRRQLLAAFGLPFEVRTADIDESMLPDEEPEAHARRLAETKARVVAGRSGPDAVVLAADTIVVHAGRILGKPENAVEARDMLESLRSAPHQVITAVALAHAETQRFLSAIHISDVTMRPYTDAEIAAYVAGGDPMDKAGAYAIQHGAFQPVAFFEGCYASIMGLPLRLVADLLAEFYLIPDPNWPSACQRQTGQCCDFHP